MRRLETLSEGKSLYLIRSVPELNDFVDLYSKDLVLKHGR